jgi:translation initiation factor eIF-2B subunit gamma
VILCGDGRNLSPFSALRASGTCKPLLPVANKPMISYALEWCKSGDFKAITVVVPGSNADEVRLYIEKSCLEFPMPIEVKSFDTKFSGEMVTGLASKITSDFVVLPCDFFSDVDPQTLINIHRNNEGRNNIITGIYYKNTVENIDKKAVIADYIVHTPLKRLEPSLLDVYTKETVVDNKCLEIRTAMLWRHPNSVVSTKLLKAAIFFCNRKVLDILAQVSSDTSVSAQGKNWDKVVRDFARRSWRHRQSLEAVVMHVLSDADATFIRANNLSAYLEANRHIMKQHAKRASTTSNKQTPPKGSATIGADSTIGIDTTVDEKTSIKRTVVGNGCKIGKKCRINGCVVLDGVVMEDDVTLENCIIGKNCIIRAKARLTSCNVEGLHEVRSGTQAKNELLQRLTMESLQDDEYGVSEEMAAAESEEEESESGQSNWEQSEGEDIEDDDDGLFER